ncbi:uncharacterized protein LOC129746623 isoform X2 [Uranotaenia lowii]|uniref:uncharacterized protein LOC129746623 isoform X2 n=1 Tax=Uranotaenia lowii TaxID=190385 RepID=UPI0024789455|nr:uncharacterized protein LOC129746623 isoform X2 [Uranotaenia lowii]
MKFPNAPIPLIRWGLLLELVLLLVFISHTAEAESCPEISRPHATRCDQYFRCVLLPSKTHVWVPTQCDKGLIYEPQLKTCVLPGDDWECDLSTEVGSESGENVYGINNLPAAIYTGPTSNPIKATSALDDEDQPEIATDRQAPSVVRGGPSQATIYDNTRDQMMNDAQYYGYQTTLVDSYGNRYPTKSVVPNISPMYSYPPSPPMVYPVFNQNYQYQNSDYDSDTIMNRLRNTEPYYNDDSSSNEENALSSEDDEDSSEANESESIPSRETTSNTKNSEEDYDNMEMKKVFSVGDATLNYKDYKDSILPLLDANPQDVRISVLTCTLGSRQPNKTDCTKYYVCNPHNGAFQSFTCPSFTAFNPESRLCDSMTYKSCQNNKVVNPSSESTALQRLVQLKQKNQQKDESSKLKSELKTAQKYVDLIKKEAFKIFSRTKDETVSNPSTLVALPTMSSSRNPMIAVPIIQNIPQTKQQIPKPPNRKTHQKKRPAHNKTSKPHQIRSKLRISPSTTTTTTSTTPEPTTPTPKAPRCKRNGKMPDPAVKNNYYVCYQSSPKKFIKTRMACPAKLVYCKELELCMFEKDCAKAPPAT